MTALVVIGIPLSVVLLLLILAALVWRGSKKPSSYSLREMAGELTPAELREQKRQDDEIANRNALQDALWTRASQWQDVDGRWHDI